MPFLTSLSDDDVFNDLLERLEISIIKMSVCRNILDFRVDASTYKKIYLKEEEILDQMGTVPIGDIVTSIQNFGAYSLCNEINFVDTGIPFLMTQNIRDNYIDWSGVRNIDLKSHQILYKSHCSNNQVLITMAGEYLGRAAVYDKDFVCSSNQAIAKLSLIDGYSPYYVSTFINCRYGQDQISRFKTVTGQPNINMGLIKYLQIPNVSDELCLAIEKTVLLANQKLLEANKKIEAAESIITKILRVYDWVIRKETISVRTYRQLCNAERMDSEYFQMKYDDYDAYVKNFSGGYTTPSEKFECVKTKCSHELAEYSYVEIGDIDVGNGANTPHIVSEEDLPANAKIMTKIGDIIISTVRPYRGAVSILDKDGLLVSGAFTVLREKGDYPAETLQILLRTPIYKDWLLKYNVGTSYPVIKDKDVLNLPIPIFDDRTNGEIKKLVKESNDLFNSAKELLELAKTAVETAIEKNESEAINLLKVVF